MGEFPAGLFPEQPTRTDVEEGEQIHEHDRNCAGNDAEVSVQDQVLVGREEGQLAGARATVVDTNGRVVADSEVQLSALENEGRRPEFAAALRGETSVVTRKRNDYGVAVLYASVPVSGGAVRLAYPLNDVDIAIGHARRILFLGGGLALLAGLAISWLTAATIVPTKVRTDHNA